MTPKAITFFYPYLYPNGVSEVFLRIGKYLTKKHSVKVRYIDYEEGYISKSLKEDKRFEVIHFSKNKQILLRGKDIFIMQSLLPFNIPKELIFHTKTRVVFWSMHQLNFIPNIPFLSKCLIHRKRLHRFLLNHIATDNLKSTILELNKKKSLFFIDDSMRKFTEQRLGIALKNPVFLPVPFEKEKLEKKQPKNNVNEINIGWLGMLYDFKIHILVYTLKALSEYSKRKKIKINYFIIGKGPKQYLIKINELENEYFKVEFNKLMVGEVLKKFLLANVDIMTSMGTAALDSAKLGIPTVLLDVSYKPIKGNYRFRWIYDSINCLGAIIDSTYFENGEKSIDRLLKEIEADYKRVSERTRMYCEENHSVGVVGKRFRETIQKSSFKYQDFNPLILKKSLIRKSYEMIRNR